MRPKTYWVQNQMLILLAATVLGSGTYYWLHSAASTDPPQMEMPRVWQESHIPGGRPKPLFISSSRYSLMEKDLISPLDSPIPKIRPERDGVRPLAADVAHLLHFSWGDSDASSLGLEMAYLHRLVASFVSRRRSYLGNVAITSFDPIEVMVREKILYVQGKAAGRRNGKPARYTYAVQVNLTCAQEEPGTLSLVDLQVHDGSIAATKRDLRSVTQSGTRW